MRFNLLNWICVVVWLWAKPEVAPSQRTGNTNSDQRARATVLRFLNFNFGFSHFAIVVLVRRGSVHSNTRGPVRVTRDHLYKQTIREPRYKVSKSLTLSPEIVPLRRTFPRDKLARALRFSLQAHAAEGARHRCVRPVVTVAEPSPREQQVDDGPDEG